VATTLVEELGAAALVDLDTVIIMLVLHRVTGFAIALNCGNASTTIRLGFGKHSDN
jgi:5-enolpyruvylshikimate-3-phosphate synthase